MSETKYSYNAYSFDELIVWLAAMRRVVARRNPYYIEENTLRAAFGNQDEWTQQLDHIDRLTGMVNDLWQHYADNNCDRPVYLPCFSDEDRKRIRDHPFSFDTYTSHLAEHLTADQQFENYLTIRIFTRGDEYLKQWSRAQSDPEKKMALLAVMNGTFTGQLAVRALQTLDIDVLFSDMSDTPDTESAAWYDSQIFKIMISHQHGDDDDSLALEAVHEARHAHQHRHYPELFSVHIDPFDRFIATKLKEADAIATHEFHIAETRSAQYPEGYEHLYKTLFLQHFLNTLGRAEIWKLYEEKTMSPDIIAAVRAGTFAARIRSSPFMQPEFLHRFCISPDGHPYLPANAQPIIDEIIGKIAVVHFLQDEPVMAPCCRAKSLDIHLL